jgi:hypothetical protein
VLDSCGSFGLAGPSRASSGALGPQLFESQTPEVAVDDHPHLETVLPEPRPVDLSDPHLAIPAGVGAILITDAEDEGRRVSGLWLEGPGLHQSPDRP